MQRIAIISKEPTKSLASLFDALGAAFHVAFEHIGSLEQYQHSALICLGPPPCPLPDLKRRGIKSIHISNRIRTASEQQRMLHLSQSSSLDKALQGLSSPCNLCVDPLTAAFHQEEILGSIGSIPFWTICDAEPLMVQSSIPLLPLDENARLIDVLQETDFMSLLPLYDFLRRICSGCPTNLPPLRATLIIDDPNLHTLGYGKLDYRKLVAQAREHNFHACMAMIPLDCWYENRAAVQLFKKESNFISLTVHGNNHSYRELAAPVDAPTAQASLLQAQKRITSFEAKTGLSVSRVMVPPHGACSMQFHKALCAAGYHGVTTTRTAVWKYSPSGKYAAESGLGLGEVVGGMPVLHRFRFTSKQVGQRIALSAYLRQPIIAYGHHEDFKEGIDAFNSVAGLINRLSPQWLSPDALIDQNYTVEESADTMLITPYTRRILLPRLSSSRQIKLDMKAFEHGPEGFDSLTLHLADGAQISITEPSAATVIPAGTGHRLLINRKPTERALKHTAMSMRTRRIFSELRDRVASLS